MMQWICVSCISIIYGIILKTVYDDAGNDYRGKKDLDGFFLGGCLLGGFLYVGLVTLTFAPYPGPIIMITGAGGIITGGMLCLLWDYINSVIDVKKAAKAAADQELDKWRDKIDKEIKERLGQEFWRKP